MRHTRRQKGKPAEPPAEAPDPARCCDGMPRPPGWRATAAQRLAAGYALGALRLQPDGGISLRVALTERGRALVAAEAAPRDAYICSLRGKLCAGDPDDEAYGGREKLYVAAARLDEPAKFLLLARPTLREPGNLCNTAGGGGGANNARLARQNGSNIVRVYATRAIAAGDEILVPYGSGYTRALASRGAGAADAPVRDTVALSQRRSPGGLMKRTRCPRCNVWRFPAKMELHTRLGICRKDRLARLARVGSE